MICLFSNSLWANKTIDHLESQLPTVSVQERIEILNTLATNYRETSPQKSIDYGEQSLKLAEELHKDRDKAIALSNIGIAYNNLGSYSKALKYHLDSLKLWEKMASEKEMAESLINLGITYWRLDDYAKALDYCLKSLAINETIDNQEGIAKALHNTGIVYDLLGSHDKALEFLQSALVIRENLGNKADIADTLNNIGIIYYFANEFDKSLEYYLRSSKLQEEVGDKKGLAKSLNNIGFTYKGLHNLEKAQEYYLKSLQLSQELDNYYEVANISNNLGQLYIELRDYEKAFSYLDQALKLAQAKGISSKSLFRENYEFFSDLYVAQGDYQKALEFYKKSSAVKDQMFSEESRAKIADLQTTNELEKQEKEIDLLKKESDIKESELARQRLLRNSLVGGFALVVILALVLYHLYHVTKKANLALSEAHRIIRSEKDKSDKLLLNILPVRVAADLKEKHKTEPESFEEVTVYFSDVVGFTKLSAQLYPSFLIGELNDIFTAFDNIAENNHCERIKTIGDAYLCVCGMPESNPHHAINIVTAAIEIIEYLRQRNQGAKVKWEIRVGIHTGRVVGGVVGVKKYIYDVFGDTINTASRMESNSEAMKINISETTYQLVKDKFETFERGSLPVKGKGEMKMYFVVG